MCRWNGKSNTDLKFVDLLVQGRLHISHSKLSWSFFSVDTVERGSPVTQSYSTSSIHTCRPHSYQSQRVPGSSHEVNVVLQSLGTCRDVLRVRAIVGSVCGCVCVCMCVCGRGGRGKGGWRMSELIV